jgi:hypothetical protein
MFSICQARTITAGATWTSDIISTMDITYWTWAFQVIVTGTGTLTISQSVSIDGTNFTIQATKLKTAFASNGGPGADGKDLVTFTAVTAPYIRFVLTEAGATNPVVASLYICGL